MCVCMCVVTLHRTVTTATAARDPQRSPTDYNWPRINEDRFCPKWKDIKAAQERKRRRLRDEYSRFGEPAVALLDRMLALDPSRRAEAGDLLDDNYFWEGVQKADDSLPWDLVLVRNMRTEQLRKQDGE